MASHATSAVLGWCFFRIFCSEDAFTECESGQLGKPLIDSFSLFQESDFWFSSCCGGSISCMDVIKTFDWQPNEHA